MKKSLVRQELFMNRRSWWIGGLVILFFNAFFAGMADTYTQNAQMLDVLKSMPSAMLQGFGIHPETMGSFEGWMAGEPFTFFILLLGAFAAIWTGVSIARERDQQTAEFLFTLPFTRPQVYLSKAAAHLIQLTAVFALSAAVTLGFGQLFSTVNSPASVVLLFTAGYLVSLAFAGIGYALTGFLASERTALSLGVGIVLVSFLLNMLAGMSDKVSWLSRLSLFHAIDSQSVVTGHRLTLAGVWLTLGVYAAGLVLGLAVLRKKDF